MSRGSQATETFLHRPTVNKASHHGQASTKGSWYDSIARDEISCVAQMNQHTVLTQVQFPNPVDRPVVGEQETFYVAEEWGELVDSNETDPDWEPFDGYYADMNYEEGEQV